MNKTARAFFRGRDSREERLHLVSLSKKEPELLDAGITAWFFFRDKEKGVGKAPLVGFFDFFKVREVERTSDSIRTTTCVVIKPFVCFYFFIFYSAPLCSTSTR